MMMNQIATITDTQRFVSACLTGSKYPIATHDDGFGPLWISRNSIGINGIVRAKTFEDAYGICEDEFFSEATETVDELIKEYGFRREHKKVVRDSSVLTAGEHTGVGERFATMADYLESNSGRLLPEFVRWATVSTPDPEAWMENECFCESYGFRPNGPNSRDTLNHGIYSKDLNGDYLEPLTAELCEQIGITIETEDEE